jgi:hypothetical protein
MSSRAIFVLAVVTMLMSACSGEKPRPLPPGPPPEYEPPRGMSVPAEQKAAPAPTAAPQN